MFLFTGHPFFYRLINRKNKKYNFNLFAVQKPALTILLIMLCLTYSNAAVPDRTGWWKFDDPTNLTKAETGFGIPLILSGNHSFNIGPDVENGAISIGAGSYYRMIHQISPNTGENKINEYTLQYDFKIDRYGTWRSFFQTSSNNQNDGEFFINPNGQIGVSAVGYSSYSVNPNEWYRLVISVKNMTQFNVYIDGKLLMKGIVQPVDWRFALDKELLIFADENGEDGLIYCSELAVWNKALTSEEVLELGGYQHSSPAIVTQVPYLQSPGSTSLIICWHDTTGFSTKILFGTDSTKMANEAVSSSEIIYTPLYWHTVKLTSLKPDTRYFYTIKNEEKQFGPWSFRTLPETGYTGKLRFLLLSDTHNPDTAITGQIIRQAQLKISELYGPDIENHLTGIIHSGDIVMNGDSPEQYYKQFFLPLSSLSPYVTTMVSAGNHEVESSFFYQYLKLDDLSAYPAIPALKEKILQLRVGNSLFLGLNTNITAQFGLTMANWLDLKLKEAENDTEIDFVFLFMHHPPFSELWDYTNSNDRGTLYVREVLLPVIKKYTKVQQLNYGHTHGFERGTIQTDQKYGDFRIICGGGGGGPLDPWAPGENRDFNDITKTISNYVFQVLEIDISKQMYQNKVYSLGTLKNKKNGVLIDSWYKSINQDAPQTPKIENISIVKNDSISITTSLFKGIDSLMTVQLQIIESGSASNVLTDTLIQKTNIFGVDEDLNPVDLNRNSDIYNTLLPIKNLSGRTLLIKTRYRDNNLKWSNWSEFYQFIVTDINDILLINCNLPVFHIFPNPFKNTTTLKYEINNPGLTIIRIYDINQKIVFEKHEGLKPKGIHFFQFQGEMLKNGTYLCEMISGNEKRTITIIKTD